MDAPARAFTSQLALACLQRPSSFHDIRSSAERNAVFNALFSILNIIQGPSPTPMLRISAVVTQLISSHLTILTSSPLPSTPLRLRRPINPRMHRLHGHIPRL